MNCTEVVSNLQLFIDEELPYVYSETMREHFAACMPCSDKLAAERRLKEVLRESCSPAGCTEAILNNVKGVLYSAV